MLRAQRVRESISRKVKQQNKTSSAQMYLNQTSIQIFNYKCTFDNYPKCGIIDWDSAVDCLGQLFGLVVDSSWLIQFTQIV